jgi:two-component system, OmpR family, phosphate regulon response regulator PhoB
METTGNDAAAAGLVDNNARSPAKRRLDQRRALPRRGNRERTPRRVLIVDDDPAIRMLCAFNLQQEGLVVVEAADGRLALEQARSERPDLVVTDVMMPGLDGFDLAEALRRDERTREIPLIFLSGEAEPANTERARALGALAYVTKPFDPLALASLVAGELGCAGELEQGPATLPAPVAHGHPSLLELSAPPRLLP